MTRRGDTLLCAAKERALRFLDAGDIPGAFKSLTTDLTRAPELWQLLDTHWRFDRADNKLKPLREGDLNTVETVRPWIEGLALPADDPPHPESLGSGKEADSTTYNASLRSAKDRALKLVDAGELIPAFRSLAYEIKTNSQLHDLMPVLQEIGMPLLMSGELNTPQKMRDWIEGFQ